MLLVNNQATAIIRLQGLAKHAGFWQYKHEQCDKPFKVIMNEIPSTAAEILERIMQTAKAAVPESLSQDIKENVRSAIQDVIRDLDVVTREELDVQKEVLKKTRAKVDEMEKVIADLEKQLEI